MPKSTRPLRALLCAVAAVLLLPAASAPAATTTSKYPVITKVSPKKLGIGDTMTISGKGFRKGKSKNTVVFKRDGGRAVFFKATATATKTKIRIVVPAKLLPFLLQKDGVAQSTRFRIRILAGRFGKRFTTLKASPYIGPRAVAVGTADDCDGDQIPNSSDSDDDNDLLSDSIEEGLKLDPCKRDTDGDGMSDGWEYYSALDLNGKAKPFNAAKPYPNPLFKEDGAVDNDGDGLVNLDEYTAWATFGQNKLPLNYSGGNLASAGRGPVPDGMGYMDRDRNGFLSDFERDADGDGIPNMDEDGFQQSTVRLTQSQDPNDPRFYDFGLFSEAYIQKVVEQTKDNPDSSTVCDGVNQVFFYCVDKFVKVSKVEALDWLSNDSDGDGIRDGDDDADHDDAPNMQEYMEELATPFADRHYVQLDACYPSTESRSCSVGGSDYDGDGLLNRDDLDDDNDLLPDTLERQYKMNPVNPDTDGDGVEDGFEYYSALDLNSYALPYPSKRPYPNPLDKEDAGRDFDGDTLTLEEEFQAWKYAGRSVPLRSYSDGTQRTGGGPVDDADKDVDGDGLSNFDETHGAMRIDWWTANFDTETVYPNANDLFLEPSFVDPDSDGDGIQDGADDQDHDGFTNAEEVRRPANWQTTYVSVTHDGAPSPDPYARVQPFNPCKPVYSSYCHKYAPAGYYPDTEDWASPIRP